MTKTMHRAVVSPRGPEPKKMSSLRSPQTITLGNQSENILRGMAASSSTSGLVNAMVTPSQHPQRFTQTAHQALLPMLPNMGEPSRPIRISRRKPAAAAPLYATHPNGEELLSASPTELKLMYDEATWRMYHLIQTARSEKQAAKASAPESSAASSQGSNNNWPSNNQFIYDDSFFQLQQQQQLHNTPPPTAMGMRPAVVSPDEDCDVEDYGEECVFELDDM